jgi:hypothetical protein
VFTLITWFIAMGAVIILGAVVGRVIVSRRVASPSVDSPRQTELTEPL